MLHNALVSMSNERVELDLRLPSIARSLGRSNSRSFDRSVARSLGHSVAQSLNRSMGRSVARSFVRLVARSLDRSRARPLARSHDRSIARSLHRSIVPSLDRARSLDRSLTRPLTNHFGGSNFELQTRSGFIWGVRVSNYLRTPYLFSACQKYEFIFVRITTEYFDCFKE